MSGDAGPVLNLTSSVNVKVQNLFPTPLAIGQFEGSLALADELAVLIRDRMAQDVGVTKSNIGGWHSEGDMNFWAGLPALRLSAAAIKVAQALSAFEDGGAAEHFWQCVMWANVSGKGDFNTMHVHPGSLWSAVFYVDMGQSIEVPDADIGGQFVIEDPRYPLPTMRMGNFRMIDGSGVPQQSNINIFPKMGDLIVFPAWLRHMVRPYTGNRQRISVAMNIEVKHRNLTDARAERAFVASPTTISISDPAP